MNLRHKIVEALETIKHENDSRSKYLAILAQIREQKIDLTQTRSGYWFNLTMLSDDHVRSLYDKIVAIRQSIDSYEDVERVKGV